MKDSLELELISAGAKPTPLSLEFPKGLAMAEWAEWGRRLLSMDERVHWWIGDWAAFGEHEYGSLKAFAETNRVAYGTLRNACYVSKSIEMSRRRDNLGWSFHYEVAALEPKEQAKWLALAEKENLAVVALRKAIRQAGAKQNALESDGPIIQFASHLVDQLMAWLKGRQADFWTAERREAWRTRLAPVVKFYEAL